MNEAAQPIEEAPVNPASEAENAEVEQMEAVAEEVTEEAATSEEDAEGEDKPKRRSRAEERIHALTRERYEAQQRAEQAERRIQEMQAWLQQQQMQRTTEPPKLADYDYDENAYQQAIQHWHVSQVQEMQRQQAIQQQQYAYQQQQVQRQQALMQKAQEAIQQYPDWQQKVNDPSLPPLAQINPAAFEAVANSDQFAAVTYYLANNPQEVYGFQNMDPVSAIRKVAQLEAKLAAQPQGGGKAPPKPPSRVRGNAEAVKDPEKMDMNEWLAWRNRQLNQR